MYQEPARSSTTLPPQAGQFLPGQVAPAPPSATTVPLRNSLLSSCHLPPKNRDSSVSSKRPIVFRENGFERKTRQAFDRTFPRLLQLRPLSHISVTNGYKRSKKLPDQWKTVSALTPVLPGFYRGDSYKCFSEGTSNMTAPIDARVSAPAHSCKWTKALETKGSSFCCLDLH